MAKPISPTQKILNIWAVILIVWSLYRTKLSLPEWFDEFIAKPIVFIIPVYWYIRTVEKKNFLEAIWLKSKKFAGDIILGLVIGTVFVLAALSSHYLKTGSLELGKTVITSGLATMGFIFILALATAFSEEILSRGFILKRLYEESNNIFSASFNASVLFFILHIPILFTNEKLSGSLLLVFMTTDILLSLANSYFFLLRRSLLLPILIHAFYNFVIVFYI